MIKPSERASSYLKNIAETPKVFSPSRSDKNSEMLIGIFSHHQKHIDFRYESTIARGFSESLMSRKTLNNLALENIRFNIGSYEPTLNARILVTGDSIRRNVNGFEPRQKDSNLVDMLKTDQNIFTFTGVVGALAPTMEYIVQYLNRADETMLIGAIPNHMAKNLRIPIEKARLNLANTSQELLNITYQEFKSKYASNVNGISKINAYLLTCSNAEKIIVGDLVKHDYEFLLSKRYGHTIIRSLLAVHPQITTDITNMCVTNFCTLSTNEYASRVMQRLVEISTSFRTYALKRFYKNNSLWLRSVAGLFLLTACMQYSEPAEYKFVIDLLLNDQKKLIQSKIMKRALVSVIDTCSHHELVYIYQFLHISSNFEKYLEDKFMTYIMIAFTRRVYIPIVNIISQKMANQFKELASKRYFRLLANKIVSVGNEEVVKRMNEGLLMISSANIYEACDGGRNIFNLYYYIFLTISTFRTEGEEETPKQVKFVKNLCIDPIVNLLDTTLVALLTKCVRR